MQFAPAARKAGSFARRLSIAGLNAAEVAGVADDEAEDGLDRGVAMDLRVGAPALVGVVEEQSGSQHRQESAPVEPVVSVECVIGQRFDFMEGRTHQPDVALVNRRVVHAEFRVVLMQAELARLVRKQLVRSVEKLLGDRTELSDFAIHSGGSVGNHCGLCIPIFQWRQPFLRTNPPSDF